MRTMIVGSLRDQPGCKPQSDELFIDIDCKGVNLLAFERVEPVARMGYEAAKPALESWLATRRSAV